MPRDITRLFLVTAPEGSQYFNHCCVTLELSPDVDGAEQVKKWTDSIAELRRYPHRFPNIPNLQRVEAVVGKETGRGGEFEIREIQYLLREASAEPGAGPDLTGDGRYTMRGLAPPSTAHPLRHGIPPSEVTPLQFAPLSRPDRRARQWALTRALTSSTGRYLASDSSLLHMGSKADTVLTWDQHQTGTILPIFRAEQQRQEPAVSDSLSPAL
ncbi:hypothetical protein CPSG_02065 [Coccidioides posadasii str. Silveira]|uniref:Uncharacterized protein n=1 Tax=Coccidioides posadasii (strain RMSCC 757 / Silveira) TaxID=443226 RepID=E9CX82_COCPS|nr:hypothetical protein CPSG_02065 [Coccidioides posadasii str. Silveira]